MLFPSNSAPNILGERTADFIAHDATAHVNTTEYRYKMLHAEVVRSSVKNWFALPGGEEEEVQADGKTLNHHGVRESFTQKPFGLCEKAQCMEYTSSLVDMFYGRLQ